MACLKSGISEDISVQIVQKPKILSDPYVAFLTELIHLPYGASLSWQVKKGGNFL